MAKNKAKKGIGVTGAVIAGVAAGAAAAYLSNEKNRQKVATKLSEVGEAAQDKLNDVSPEAGERLEQAKAKLSEMGETAQDKLNDLSPEAGEKLEEAKSKTQES